AEEDAVGPEDDREPVLPTLGGEVEDVRPEERLAAGEDQERARIDPGDVRHHPAALVRRQPPHRRRARGAADVAVSAKEGTALGEIPRDRVRLVCHWMTSSERASSEGESVSPSVLAVFRLITSSNLLGCSTSRQLWGLFLM